MTAVPNFGSDSPGVHNPLLYPRRILLEVLQNVFKQSVFPSYIPGNNPFRLVLTPSGEIDKTSKIVIADSYSEEIFRTDMRPVIIVDGGDLSFGDLSIDGRLSTAIPPTFSNGGRVVGMGTRTKAKFMDIVQVPLSVFVYARNKLQTEQLSSLVGLFIRFHEREIKEGARLFKIDSPMIGKPTPVRVDSKYDLFVASISFITYQTLSWSIKTIAPTESPFSNFSGSIWPIAVGSPFNVDVEAVPEDLTETQKNHWLSLSPGSSPL